MTNTAPPASTLDRRRAKMQKANAAGESAAAAVAEIDEQIESNSTKSREHEVSLQSALDQVAAAKKAIKAATKESVKLQKARKKTRRTAATTQQKATTAESKYDRAMLSDMLRRQKEIDLATHASSAPQDTAQDTSPQDMSLKQETADAGHADRDDNTSDTDEPVRSSSRSSRAASTGTGTARATAARATAARARSATSDSQEPASDSSSDDSSSNDSYSNVEMTKDLHES